MSELACLITKAGSTKTEVSCHWETWFCALYYRSAVILISDCRPVQRWRVILYMVGSLFSYSSYVPMPVTLLPPSLPLLDPLYVHAPPFSVPPNPSYSSLPTLPSPILPTLPPSFLPLCLFPSVPLPSPSSLLPPPLYLCPWCQVPLVVTTNSIATWNTAVLASNIGPPILCLCCNKCIFTICLLSSPYVHKPPKVAFWTGHKTSAIYFMFHFRPATITMLTTNANIVTSLPWVWACTCQQSHIMKLVCHYECFSYAN